MSDWKREDIPLKHHHTWKAPPGYKIFIADKGAVRFNIPQDWIIKPDPDSLKFHDHEPPGDTCVLAFSYLRLGNINWNEFPVTKLVQVAVKGDARQILQVGKVVSVPRQDLELAWIESRFFATNENRDAYSRLSIGRAANLQSLITLDYWPEDVERISAVWNEVMRSLELGRIVQDPSVGDVLQ